MIAALHSFISKLNSKPIGWVMLIGLVINLCFVIWGADRVLGGGKYIGNDTPGWVNAFLNLWHTGNYSFDLANPDAYMGRVPGYSFFWGIHYILFGADYAYQAVAVSQSMLGALSVYLIYSVAMKLFQQEKIALLAAVLYAFYPFAICWVSVSYSEYFSCFVNLVFFNVLLKKDKSNRDYIVLGILCALSFYIREFMGITLVVAVFYVFIEEGQIVFKQRATRSLIIVISFLALYGIWPARNLINHNRLVFGRSYEGYLMYKDHMLSYLDWVHCWDSDDSEWLKRAIVSDPMVFPDDIFSSTEEKQSAIELVKKANECGTSFVQWQKVYHHTDPAEPVPHCNKEIEEGFNQLRHSFVAHQPWRYFTGVPLQNLKKSIFKNQVQEGSAIIGKPSLTNRILFGYRTLLILLALAGLLISWKNRKTYPVAFLFVALYGYVCWIYRYVEMRNYMQVDVLLLIPAAFSLWYGYQKIKQAKVFYRQ